MILYQMAFDGPGALVTTYLQEVLAAPAEERREERWLILEQMHRFDFVGPSVAQIASLLTLEAVGVYGLRGRLFGPEAQIEWRRLGPDLIRVVACSEDARWPRPPGQANGDLPAPVLSARTEGVSADDAAMLLFGTSRDGEPYYEQRVQGSDEISYPSASTGSQGTVPGVSYPVLRYRWYKASGGDEIAWRLLAPDVRSQEDLLHV